MLLTRFEPVSEFRDLRKGFDYLNSVMEELEGQNLEDSMSAFVPTVNSREADDAYYVEVDLPGVKKEDISVDVKDNILSISGERKIKKEDKEDTYYKVESKYGKFVRNFTLPKDVDVQKIEASNKNGVLEVKIPKQVIVEKKPKKIEIK